MSEKEQASRIVIKTVNGREIINIKVGVEVKYVLAYLPKKDEWVTWEADDAVENFYRGHYFKDRESAEKDFHKRGI